MDDEPDDGDNEGNDELKEADLFTDDLSIQDHEPDNKDNYGNDELAEGNFFVNETGRKSSMYNWTQEIVEDLVPDNKPDNNNNDEVELEEAGEGPLQIE